jgi:hypothetical protein
LTRKNSTSTFDVQRDHRQPFGQARGQQRTAAGEADGGLHVAGFQPGDRLAVQLLAVDREQALVHGQHQLALWFQVAQAQFHLVVREFPGAIELALHRIHQVQALGERLVGIQRRGERHRQGAGTVELHFRDIHHVQFAAGVALRQRGHIDRRRCRRRGGRSGLFGGCGFVDGRRVARAEQRQRTGQPQSFVEHGG